MELSNWEDKLMQIMKGCIPTGTLPRKRNLPRISKSIIRENVTNSSRRLKELFIYDNTKVQKTGWSQCGVMPSYNTTAALIVKQETFLENNDNVVQTPQHHASTIVLTYNSDYQFINLVHLDLYIMNVPMNT